MLLPKVYSKSLKKLKKQQVFECSILKIQKMQQEIQRSAQTIQIKQKPIKNYILARKQLIEHRHSKNKLQQQVDRIMKNLVDNNHLAIKNTKIKQKHNYKHYRIQTQPIQKDTLNLRKKKDNFMDNQQQQEEQDNITKHNHVDHSNSHNSNSKLPQIQKSASHSVFQKSKTRKLKTQHQLIERLSQNPKNKLLDYINIDSAIRQYRSGMTSLIKGVYYNPHNPYNNSKRLS